MKRIITSDQINERYTKLTDEYAVRGRFLKVDGVDVSISSLQDCEDAKLKKIIRSFFHWYIGRVHDTEGTVVLDYPLEFVYIDWIVIDTDPLEFDLYVEFKRK